MPTNITPTMRSRARRLRREATPIEGNLWSRLKTLRRSHGLHFRRQAPIGPYVADFACLSPRLVVEIDGQSHDRDGAARHDERRDAFLRSEGFRILRVSYADVMRDADSVIETIIEETRR
jgi:very-short-patch-repair endonuclease